VSDDLGVPEFAAGLGVPGDPGLLWADAWVIESEKAARKSRMTVVMAISFARANSPTATKFHAIELAL